MLDCLGKSQVLGFGKMLGGKELGLPRSSACSLKEQLARTVLRNVKSQGHSYVELREENKKFIFFCTLCLARCYSDSVLYEHLRGKLHTKRLAAAKSTLLKPNPWPFNDGVVFFHEDSLFQDSHLSNSGGSSDGFGQKQSVDQSCLALVRYGENPCPAQVYSDMLGVRRSRKSVRLITDREDSYIGSVDEECYDLCIPGVLMKDAVCDLVVRLIGIGQVSARYCQEDDASQVIRKIWCEWLGLNHFGSTEAVLIPEHDFAIVTFAYDYDLGRKGLLDDLNFMLSSIDRPDKDENGHTKGKKRKSFSDPEDVSESLTSQYDSSGDESLSVNSSTVLVDSFGSNKKYSRVLSSKNMRRELRRQQHVASERMCDICRHKMLPGKDVATLLNRKTGKIVCSSRNVNGAFHVFHVSCLIHWILLCEVEIYTKQSVGPKEKRKRRRKNGNKISEREKEGMKALRKQPCSVFCPECQGTGIDIDGNDLEKPIVLLSELFKYKIKLGDACRAWMNNPEVLQNCSVGFYFPSQSEEAMQETVLPLKLLHFYRAGE